MNSLLDVDERRYGSTLTEVYRDALGKTIKVIVSEPDKNKQPLFLERDDYAYDEKGRLVGRRQILHSSQKPIAGPSTIYYVYQKVETPSGQIAVVSTPYHRDVSDRGIFLRTVTESTELDEPGGWVFGLRKLEEYPPLEEKAQVEIFVTDRKNELALYPVGSDPGLINPNPRVPESVRLKCIRNKGGGLLRHSTAEVGDGGKLSPFSGDFLEFDRKNLALLWSINIPNSPDPKIVSLLDSSL